MGLDQKTLQSCWQELRSAVQGGRWTSVLELCDFITPWSEASRTVLHDLVRQASLHIAAAGMLGAPDNASRQAPIRSREQRDADWAVELAVQRNYAALDGNRVQAAALLREELEPADASRADAADRQLPPREVMYLVEGKGPPASHERVVGVARPGSHQAPHLGDPGSPASIPTTGLGRSIARGTPVEVVGHWNRNKVFECCAITALGSLPDYQWSCELVEALGSVAGVADNTAQGLWVPISEPDPSIATERTVRRRGEWAAVLAATDMLEVAYSTRDLSLNTLAEVHAIVVGSSTARAGRLRQTPAVIRWNGAITYRPPGPAVARIEVARCLTDLVSELSADSQRRHPATVAAETLASILKSHPFADGNGRVSRAVASWLLLRSGFHRRGEATLSTFFDTHLAEYYTTLRDYRVAPWNWRQFFYDAVLTTFDRLG